MKKIAIILIILITGAVVYRLNFHDPVDKTLKKSEDEYLTTAGLKPSANTQKPSEEIPESMPAEKVKHKVAIFAGGCFWCTESSFEKLDGVAEVLSGYIGDTEANATYEQVSAGQTKHIEAIKVFYIPSKVNYKELLNRFWTLIDPGDGGGSFVDRGFQYTSSIFYVDEEQKKLAEQSVKFLNDSGWLDKPVATTVRKATEFYLAEDYHQDYYKKSPERYQRYRYYSGRDQFYNQFWKDKPKIFPAESSKKE